jgi:DNA-binding PadR family transcriptional regulator
MTSNIMTMRTHPPRRSPLAMALLGLLCEAPMHPYRMQQLMKERGKDEVVNVRDRASIYQTIERLLREGLVMVAETARDEKRPERTIYQLTDEGREAFHDWMGEILSTPGREFPAFPAALAFLPLLTPDDVLHQLDARIIRLEAELARTEAESAGAARFIPRLFLIEGEYQRAMLQAELEWVRTVAGELRSGQFTWNEEWLRKTVEGLAGWRGAPMT